MTLESGERRENELRAEIERLNLAIARAPGRSSRRELRLKRRAVRDALARAVFRKPS